MPHKLAIFGGTFDPVHNAHLRAAVEASEEVGLDQVLFMPCAENPHGKHIQASVEDRLEMLRLAIGDNPLFGICGLEARLGGVSYTVNTLTTLHEENPDSEIYFLIGADAFFYLHSWYQPSRLFDLAHFVVLARPKSPEDEVELYLQKALDPSFKRGADGWVRLPGGHGAKRVDTTLLSISSTKIRNRAAAGMSLAYLVPPAVEDYIMRMKLYQNPGGGS